MKILILIIIAVIGFVFGVYFARQSGGGFIAKQTKKKAENKKKVLEFLRENEKVANNDIEKLLRVWFLHFPQLLLMYFISIFGIILNKDNLFNKIKYAGN